MPKWVSEMNLKAAWIGNIYFVLKALMWCISVYAIIRLTGFVLSPFIDYGSELMVIINALICGIFAMITRRFFNFP
jgi:hypothetical protein